MLTFKTSLGVIQLFRELKLENSFTDNSFEICQEDWNGRGYLDIPITFS